VLATLAVGNAPRKIAVQPGAISAAASPATATAARMHRASGYLAILLTLPVAYHCIFLLGFDSTSPRVAIHSVLGSAFYGAFLVTVILVRSRGFPGWALPVAGGLLFATLVGLWLTSSLYLFGSDAMTR